MAHSHCTGPGPGLGNDRFLYYAMYQWRHTPPMVQNFLNFMQFFGKFGKIIGRQPLPGGLAPPPTENPGSAPVYCSYWLGSNQVTCDLVFLDGWFKVLMVIMNFTVIFITQM